MSEDYHPDYFLFKMDELIIRQFVWALIAVALWQLPFIQLGVLLGLQAWWVLFLLWHRPFKSPATFAANLLAEVGMLVNIALVVDLAKFNDHYYHLLTISIIHLVVLVGTTCSQLVYHVYTKLFRDDSRYEDEHSPLIRESQPHPVPVVATPPELQ